MMVSVVSPGGGVMEFRTLGPLEVVEGDRLVDVEGGIRRRLLCVLLASAGRSVPYASLLRAGWGEDPPPTARRSVQSHVSRLRRLGLDIRGVVEGYELRVGADRIDAHRFASFCERRAFDGASVEELREALGWWRGDAWVDLAEVMPLTVSGQLGEYRQAVEEQVVTAELAAGQPSAVADAEKLVVAAPDRERRWALWAVSLYREQRRREACDVLAEARRSLREAGLAPGALLESLEPVIVQDRPASEAVALLDRRSSSPSPSSTAAGEVRARPEHAPAQRTAGSTFVGREQEVRLLQHLLRSDRLVTITGAGGVGKTRLAVEVMDRFTTELACRAWFCELAPLSNPEAVSHAVASVLDVVANTGGSVSDALATFLGRQQGIVVLDNCEHVRDAVADLVDLWLANPGDFVILATSREPLRLRAEHVVPLAPLDPASGDGVRLFVQRAQSVLGAWEPTEAELDDVHAICVSLDGIPLGVELAAARLRSMSTRELREHLHGSVSFLRSSTRGVPRHQTLDAATEWSYELLDDVERWVFAQLSVFAGGFTTADAESVLAASDHDPRSVVDLLDDLVAKALLEVRDRTGTTRYSMLEPIRQFGGAKLFESGRSSEVRTRHAKYFAHCAAALATIVHAADVDNLRTALDWLTEQDSTELALRLVHGVAVAAVAHQHLEVGEWCARVIDLPGASEHPLAPEVAGYAAQFYYHQGRLEDAWRLVHFAESMPEYRADRLYPANVHAHLCWFRGDVDEALAQLDGIDNSSLIARVVVNWARVMYRPDGSQADGALAALSEAVNEYPAALGWYLGAQTNRTLATGSPAEAVAAAEALWQHATVHGTELDRYLAISSRAAAANLAGAVDIALLEDLVAAVELMRDRGHYSRRWILLRTTSGILWRQGERREAALVRAGVTSGPFNAPPLARMEDPSHVEAAKAAEAEARAQRLNELDELTERAIAAVDRVIARMRQP